MMPARIVEVARKQAELVDERFPGFRAELVEALGATIKIQGEGLSENGRRDGVAALVEALGSKVIAQEGID